MNRIVIFGLVLIPLVGAPLWYTTRTTEIPESTQKHEISAQQDPKNVVTSVRGVGDVSVVGPCYSGTRGNDIFPPRDMIPSDCYDLTSDGSDYLNVSSYADDVFVRVSNGSDSVVLGDGDDVIEVRGKFDMVLDAGIGFNVLHFPGLEIPDVDLRVDGADIVLEGRRGSIRMKRQYPRDGLPAPVQMMVFERSSLSASEIYLRAIDGQASDGDDILSGTPGDDVIYPGLGNDVVSALEGDDSIFYEGGHDTIMGASEGAGFDTLSFKYKIEDVSVGVLNDRDMIIYTPEGTVTLQFQVFFPVGDDRGNIEEFVFMDGVYTDQQLRGMAAK